MKKFDKIIIFSILLLALVGYIYINYMRDDNFTSKKAQISVDGEIYKTINLTEDKDETIELDTEFGKNTIRVYNQGVNIIEADCPDKICVKDGFIDKAGQILVCLPNKVSVEILGEREDEVDDSAY